MLRQGNDGDKEGRWTRQWLRERKGMKGREKSR